jgi:predicted regulator of Ras-like GTPase activity (Roadblock/LC7/MglB family)
MAKHEILKQQLENLKNSLPDIKGVLLASVEGLPVAHALTNGADPNRLAAMAAAAATLGRRISDSLGSGQMSEINVRSDEATLFVYSAGAKAVLCVVAPNPSNSGLIHLEARASAQEIGELF